MRKIFLLTTLLLMILTSTAFAEEVAEPTDEPTDEPYVYTSEDFKFTINCPIKPVAIVENPWQEPEKRGEMLVFANEGFDIQYAYLIQVNAFDNDSVPDFNKADKKVLDKYLEDLIENAGFGSADLVSLTSTNKGVFAITAETIEVRNKETGELEGEFVADRRDIYTYFRTPEGRCVSVQLINKNFDSKELVDVYRYSVATFKDNTEPVKVDKKSKKDKEKKDKEKKDKKKKDKEKKDKKDKKDKKEKDKDKK